MQKAFALSVANDSPASRLLHPVAVHGQAAALGRPGVGRWQRPRNNGRLAKGCALRIRSA